ncbi:MAG: hypothetical protein NVS2B8_04490 [Vulcanimicrobiaceae bacterium]
MVLLEGESLALMPFVAARARIGTAPVRFRLLRPAYPAVGLGALRVLRVREIDGTTEVVAGYDGYARVADVARSA